MSEQRQALYILTAFLLLAANLLVGLLNLLVS